MVIKVGEKWRLKQNPLKVATVMQSFPVQAEAIGKTWGLNVGDTIYVTLSTYWTRKKHTGKHVTTFLKQYERAE